MKHSLLWPMLAILAIACLGFFGAASQGPPGVGLDANQLLHTTYGAVIGATMFAAAIVVAGLGLLAATTELGGRLRRRFALALLTYVMILKARVASYSASRRAFKGSTPESHYRNSRVSLSGV